MGKVNEEEIHKELVDYMHRELQKYLEWRLNLPGRREALEALGADANEVRLMWGRDFWRMKALGEKQEI